MIDFAPGLAGSISLTNGDLRISKDLMVDGPGPSVIAVNGDGFYRVFEISSGTVTLSGIKISNGGGAGGNAGGALLNKGTLTLTDTEVTNNLGHDTIHNEGSMSIVDSLVSNSSGVIAVANAGTLTMERTTITDSNRIAFMNLLGTSIATITDSAIAHNGSFFEDGGVQNFGTLNLINVTISDNRGGGVRNMAGTTTLTNCTVADNPASSGFGIGLNNSGGSIAVRNTIVANHRRPTRLRPQRHLRHRRLRVRRRATVKELPFRWLAITHRFDGQPVAAAAAPPAVLQRGHP
jgi:hypothetical protein